MIWLALTLLLMCSGVVSASETALFALDRKTLLEFRDEGALRRRVYQVMQRPRRLLMTVLMANTAVNVAIFAVSFVAFQQVGHASPAVAALAGLAAPLAVIIFGEMLPKALALSGARRFAPPASYLIAVLQVAFGPLLWLLGRLLVEPITRLLAPSTATTDTVTTEELRLLVEQSAHEGVIDSTENDLLQSVVALSTVSVREIMTPRVDIQSIRLDFKPHRVLKTTREFGRRRLLVCGRDLDDVRGVLYVRDAMLNAGAPVKSLVRRVHYVPEQVNLMQLLRHFQTENVHLAVVVDEFGGTAGLVTLDDVVQWIVGELPDTEARRRDTSFERIDADTYRLGGDLSVRVWADRFGVGEIDRHIDTVGGLILARLGRVPQTGDSVRLRNLTLTVDALQGRRIQRVRLHRHSNSASRTEASS